MLPIRDHNPSERIPYVTLALIAANIAVFLWEAAFIQTDRALSQFYFDYAMIPARLSAGESYPALITSIFLHVVLMPQASRRLILGIFGDYM